MRCVVPFIWLITGLFSCTGCGTFELSPEAQLASRQQDPVEEQLNQLVGARSIEEIDRKLEEILDGKDAQKTIERLLSDWGKHDSWYDLAVVEFIWEHWPGYYGKKSEISPGPLMSVIATRVREERSLLPQFFWYVQWRMNGLSFQRLCQFCEASGSCCRISGEEFPLILLVGSAIRESRIVSFDPPASTTGAWEEARLYFLSQRPFLRFNAEQVAYEMDYSARNEGRYLTLEEQETIPPATPLPDWDSDIVPERPVKQ